MGRRLRRLLDWRAALVYTHRWLGIAGCVLFAAWFVSGIVMMYARMPSLAPEEKLARAARLDLSTATISPADAAKRAGVSVDDMLITMLRGRPIYRFAGGRGRRGGSGGPAAASGAAAVFADTGEPLRDTGIDDARAAARVFEPAYAGTLHDDGYLTQSDQWTLQARQLLPMYRFALDDAAGTRLYVSAVSGEVVLRTTRKERFWGYLGPVIHWIYFTPLRRNGPLWTEVIIWSSLAGCLMCATGLVWGAVRFSPFARFRLKRVQSRTPYVGWMKWHHYAGLIFGVVTLTWVYSGLLSMGPFNWFRPVGGRNTTQSREAGDARRKPPADLTLDGLRAAHAVFSSSFTPKALRMVRVDGQQYWLAEKAPSVAEADRWRSPSLLPRTFRPRLARAYVPVSQPERGPFDRFPAETLTAAAREAMGDTPVAESVWLDAYDGYYYDTRGADPLPVLRIRYADPQETWLYLDPQTGGVAQRSEKVTRLRRWLYQGLHSLDFPFLYYRRPLWDIVVIVLSVGGIALSVTTMAPAWRRLAGHLRRWGTQWRRRRVPVLIAALCGAAGSGLIASQTAAVAAPNVTTGCIDRADPAKDYFPDKAIVDDAVNFSVTYHRTYKVVETRTNPSAPGERYVLVQCGATAPPLQGALAGAQVVRVPIASLYSASTSHLPLLVDLRRLDVLTGVSNMKYLTGAEILQRASSGKVREFAAASVIDTELVVSQRPSLFMTGGALSAELSLLREAGVPVVANHEWLEPTALARAEWLKYMALFLNEEKAAQRLYAEMKSRYLALSRRALAIPDAKKPTIMTGRGKRGDFVIAGGRSYVAAMIKDAGGRYVWADNTATGTVTIDLEAQLERAGKADIWINGGGWANRQAMVDDEPRYGLFNAYRAGQVWVYERRMTPAGANDYWARGVSHPDLILADLVKIFHPQLAASHEFQWYMQVPAR